MTKHINIRPLVSVVMSTYVEVKKPAPFGEEGSMLSRAIRSVVSQSYSNWELWVISDHPPDPDRQAIEKLIESFGDQRIHYEGLPARAGLQALGVEPKRRGVARSHGELLAFLDADNAFERDHLLRCVQAFDERNEALDVVYCDTRVIYGGNFETEDSCQWAVTFPINLLGALAGEKFSDDLRKHLAPLGPGPLAGEPFTWQKPAWDVAATEKLARYNFIDTSEAVMARTAYDAVGGLQDSLFPDWLLWREMMRAGRNRFRRISHVGLRYTTETLDQHRQYYAISLIDKLNLPIDVTELHAKSEEEIKERYKKKHDGPRGDPNADERPRILFIAEAAAISHVVRPMMLAAHLSQTNYNVCFACDSRYDGLIPKNGFKRLRLSSLPLQDVLTRLRHHEPVYDVETLDLYVQQDLEVMREFKPDIVVGDQRFSLATSARLVGVPYVNIIDAHWSPAADVEIELVASEGSPLLALPVANLIFQFIRPLALGYQTMPMNIIRIKYGLPGLGPDLKTVFTYGDYTVYPNDPNLFPLKTPLPLNHLFIGPLIWSPDVEKPGWWNKLPENRPIVYVSLGSTGQPKLVEIIFRVLRQFPVTVIAATAGRQTIKSVPSNVFLADFLPGTEAAQRSRLVICNGGSMSGQQGLSAGVPYLGLISNEDQLLFSKAVSRTGACEFILESEVNEKTLHDAISKMLAQDRYQNAAKMLASRRAKLDSCQKFEELIRSIIESRGQKSPAAARQRDRYANQIQRTLVR